jgi:protein ImuB
MCSVRVKSDQVMYIPSYDDLTPPIPDADIRDMFAEAERLTRTVAPATPEPRPGPSAPQEPGLFACLRSARAPQAMFGVAREFSPRIERHGVGDVVLDVSGLGSLLGDAQAIGVELERAAQGRAADARVAVAPTQTAARLLALTSPRLVVVTADVAGALADLTLASLEQLFEERVSKPEERVLSVLSLSKGGHPREVLKPVLDVCRRWGIRTLGEFAALPPGDLSERLGQPGLAWQRLACGIDPAPLVPDPAVPRYVQSMELEWPIDALEPLSFVFARLFDPLASALEQADRAAAAIRLDLRLVDRTMHTRRLQLPAAMRDARVLRTLLLLDLESHPPSAAIDIVSIEVDPAPSRIVQFSLLERATPSAETMATVMARLRALVGETRCGFAALVDTHRPDGFEMEPWEEEACCKTARGRKPLVLSPRATDAARAAPVLRRFRPPVAIRITLDRGRPAHVAIDRRGMPGGEVVQRAGPWRSSGAWWEGEQHWDRDEWDVGFADGTVARIYRNRVSGVWFLEGVID